MSSGKIIVIEGTDCSGKETQTKKLVERLKKEGKKVFQFDFPQYETPTGRIVGGPFLGKDYICEGWFPETAPNVDPLVGMCYYAADRRYHVHTIREHLEKGEIVILDRYTFSNMAHQGCKCATNEEKMRMFKKIETLEFEVLELPRPDAVIFLYMPQEYAMKLKASRSKVETLDQNEASLEHLKAAEDTYLLLTDKFGFCKIDCVSNQEVRSVDAIHEEIYEKVLDLLK
ncbi:MAG: thymidylate kinase [Bacilli bacterium]|nr:thymidylate kinase [Bacilli bacterium]